MKPYWLKAASWAGIDLSPTQIGQMHRYGRWLAEEGVRAGGIGRDEVDRLDRRHLADSLLFAPVLADADRVWDLGTGVGLPGIPLAIAMPDTKWMLVDRSQRRVDLTRRVLRILGLENCQVVQGEIADLSGQVAAMVSRASLTPDQLREVGEAHLVAGGTLVAGGSWRQPPVHRGWTTIEIPSDVLDQPVWLLMMRRE